MPKSYEIRANYTKDTIVMYQAYNNAIAKSALHHQKFVSPFSFTRMTWIKPSFAWLMHRSNWGFKSNQENILAVHIKRSAWKRALALGILTHPEKSVYPDSSRWEEEFKNAKVHIQWDTERSYRGAAQDNYSIQVGLSLQIIQEYVDEWIVKIEDITPTVRKLYNFIKSGNMKNFNKLLPKERVYEVSKELKKKLMMD